MRIRTVVFTMIWVVCLLSMLFSCRSAVDIPAPAGSSASAGDNDPDRGEITFPQARPVDASGLKISYLTVQVKSLGRNRYPVVYFNNDLAANSARIRYCLGTNCREEEVSSSEYFLVSSFRRGDLLTVSVRSCISAINAVDSKVLCGAESSTVKFAITFAPGDNTLTVALQNYFMALRSIDKLCVQILETVVNADKLSATCPLVDGKRERLISEAELQSLTAIDSSGISSLFTGENGSLLGEALLSVVPFTYDNYLSLEAKERIIAGELMSQNNLHFDRNNDLADAAGKLISKSDFLVEVANNSKDYDAKIAAEFARIDKTNKSSIIILGSASLAISSLIMAKSSQKDINKISEDERARTIDAQLQREQMAVAGKESSAIDSYVKKAGEIYKKNTARDLKIAKITRGVSLGVASAGVVLAYFAYQGDFSLTGLEVQCAALKPSLAALEKLKEQMSSKKASLSAASDKVKTLL